MSDYILCLMIAAHRARIDGHTHFANALETELRSELASN